MALSLVPEERGSQARARGEWGMQQGLAAKGRALGASVIDISPLGRRLVQAICKKILNALGAAQPLQARAAGEQPSRLPA
jgi:hypothetical protein